MRHDSPGVVSMRKGGEFFGFTIAPAPNVNLDEENVVIGRVIEGMNVISMINEVPTSKEDSLGMKRGKKACLSLTLLTYTYTYTTIFIFIFIYIFMPFQSPSRVPGFSSVGKGFDPRAKIASVDRPLVKIRINKCTVDSANMAQLMKF